MTDATIYVVVPVFNRKKLLERFLSCLRRQSSKNLRTIVVDDGSTDGTAELVMREFREVVLLRGDGNLWWTGAINAGIEHVLRQASEDDAILVINDDVAIDEDYVERLYQCHLTMPRTLIGSVVVDHKNPNVIYDGGRTVNWWTAKFRIMNANRSLDNFTRNHVVDVSLLTGWGTLLPVQVFREIGLYDDKHFQQCGDTEFSVRAKNVGYRLVVSYDAVIKVQTDETDRINVAESYSGADIWRYYFGIKSNTRIKYRYYFARNTIENPIRLWSFLLCDFARITYHYLVRLRFGPI